MREKLHIWIQFNGPWLDGFLYGLDKPRDFLPWIRSKLKERLEEELKDDPHWKFSTLRVERHREGSIEIGFDSYVGIACAGDNGYFADYSGRSKLGKIDIRIGNLLKEYLIEYHTRGKS